MGEVKSLLGAAETTESSDDGYDSSRPLVDANNVESFEGFFLEQRPDPPGSVSSRSDDQSVQTDPPPQHQTPSEFSSETDTDVYCDAFQSQLDRRFHGSFLSNELDIFKQRNPGRNNHHAYAIPPKLKTLSVKTSSTVLETTSDSTVERNSLWAIGQDKVEEIKRNNLWALGQEKFAEITKGSCYCQKKVLIILLAAVIVSCGIGFASTPIEINREALSAPPSTTLTPSSVPSYMPSLTPSSLPTNSLVPSSAPSSNPSSSPSQNPSYLEHETIFYAVGDVPYNENEKLQLPDRMRQLPPDAEFVVHLGDIKRAGSGERCRITTYQNVRNMLRHSKVPVFIIPGDNEWNDCPNRQEAKRFWRDTFHEFDKNWNHTLNVQRNPEEPENFFFIHKRTLYFGLAILGGRVGDRGIFNNDMREKFEFVKEMIDQYIVNGDAVNAVIFGHAMPVPHHWAFFDPLRHYIHTRLDNKVPILYLNGDYHFYQSERNYLGTSSFNRLQVAQGTREPPLKIAVTASSSPNWNATEAFQHDRMLWLSLRAN